MRHTKAVALVTVIFTLFSGAVPLPERFGQPVCLSPVSSVQRPPSAEEIAEAIALAQIAVVLRKLCHDTNNTLSVVISISSFAMQPGAPEEARQFLIHADRLTRAFAEFHASLGQNGMDRTQNFFLNDGMLDRSVDTDFDLEKLLAMRPKIRAALDAARTVGFSQTVLEEMAVLRRLINILDLDWYIEPGVISAKEGLEELERNKIPGFETILEWSDPERRVPLSKLGSEAAKLMQTLNGVRWTGNFDHLRFLLRSFLPRDLDASRSVKVGAVLPVLLALTAASFQETSKEKKVLHLELRQDGDAIYLQIETDKNISSDEGFPFLRWLGGLARDRGAVENGPFVPGYHAKVWFSQFKGNKNEVAPTAVAKKERTDHARPVVDHFPTDWAMPAPRSNGGRKILVVDDDTSVRGSLMRLLLQMNLPDIELIEAGDGVEGLNRFMEHRPVLVLTDFSMPAMSGKDMAEQIRGQANGKTKIVMLTGTSISGSTPSDMYVDALLEKPFTFQELEAEVRAFLPPAPSPDFALSPVESAI